LNKYVVFLLIRLGIFFTPAELTCAKTEQQYECFVSDTAAELNKGNNCSVWTTEEIQYGNAVWINNH